jgi:hypothetical protein
LGTASTSITTQRQYIKPVGRDDPVDHCEFPHNLVDGVIRSQWIVVGQCRQDALLLHTATA